MRIASHLMKTSFFSLHPSAFNLRGVTPRRGFSFTEVLFAVMILGIGFIMIAGIFPVAISQTAATQEETIGAEMARGAAAAVTSLGNIGSVVPADGVCHPLSPALFAGVKGNQILREDPRFGWVAFLKRDGINMDGQLSPVAKLIVVPVQVRDRAAFDQRDLTVVNPGSANAYGTLYPPSVTVRLTEGNDNPDECVIVDGVGRTAVATGSVLVIGSGLDAQGQNAAGRVYRIGDLKDAGTNTWFLVPGNDMTINLGADGKIGGGDDTNEDITTPAVAYVVGHGMTDPGANQGNTPTFGGGSMAIGVYVAFIGLQ